MATKGNKHLNSFANDEHDAVEYRKRVATYVDGDTVSYEDPSFVSGDSPVICDVLTDLGRIGHKGYLVNSGPGGIKVEISTNGTNYGGQHTIKEGETFTLNDLSIKKIRLTWDSNTEYRILVA
jgi:hypothetical protein